MCVEGREEARRVRGVAWIIILICNKFQIRSDQSFHAHTRPMYLHSTPPNFEDQTTNPRTATADLERDLDTDNTH